MSGVLISGITRKGLTKDALLVIYNSILNAWVYCDCVIRLVILGFVGDTIESNTHTLLCHKYPHSNLVERLHTNQSPPVGLVQRTVYNLSFQTLYGKEYNSHLHIISDFFMRDTFTTENLRNEI